MANINSLRNYLTTTALQASWDVLTLTMTSMKFLARQIFTHHQKAISQEP
jgi:hypothetical protein